MLQKVSQIPDVVTRLSLGVSQGAEGMVIRAGRTYFRAAAFGHWIIEGLMSIGRDHLSVTITRVVVRLA